MRMSSDDANLLRALGRGGDGYDWIEEARRFGWLSSWGRDGWDLGSWPYVIVVARLRGTWQVATYVEHDITVEEFTTPEEMAQHIDRIAWFYWRAHKETWIEGIAEGEEPEHLRGPYSRERVT